MEEIEYTVVRAKIKNIYIQIKNGKVIVKAPKQVKEEYLKELVEKKSKWINMSLIADRALDSGIPSHEEVDTE